MNQPPRPGGGAGPRPGAGAGSVGTGGVGGRPGGVALPRERVQSVSNGTVLGTFLILVFATLLTLLMTKLAWGHGTPTVSMWVGFLTGLFGCTVTFGTLQFFVNQQYAAGTFSDWAFKISKMTIARVATIVGWLAGSVNCYLLAHHFARSVA